SIFRFGNVGIFVRAVQFLQYNITSFVITGIDVRAVQFEQSSNFIFGSSFSSPEFHLQMIHIEFYIVSEYKIHFIRSETSLKVLQRMHVMRYAPLYILESSRWQ